MWASCYILVSEKNANTYENELLEQVVNAFQAETGLALGVVQGLAPNDQQVDFMVELPNNAGILGVATKSWAQQANIGALADQIHRLPIKL